MPPKSPRGGRRRSNASSPRRRIKIAPRRLGFGRLSLARRVVALRAETPRGAERRQRTGRAVRRSRRANKRAELHQRLNGIAGARRAHERRGLFANERRNLARRRLHCVKTRDDALDIAVDGGAGLIESDGGDRRRRIGTYSGKPAQRRFVARKSAGKFDDRTGAGVQIARPGVVAEPRPLRENVIERRARQIIDRRPARQEGRIALLHRRDGRLLQHDFGEPDPIGVRRFARPRAPGQLAPMGVVPGEQRRARFGRSRARLYHESD